MKQPKFKKDEWCFCEFKLQQITETEENRITGVSDGHFSMGGSDLSRRCYPLTMKIKVVSDTVAYWSSAFHELKCNSLNHPDLNRELIRRWVEMCDAIEDEAKFKTLYESLSEFGRLVQTKVRDVKYETIEGINIFTR